MQVSLQASINDTIFPVDICLDKIFPVDICLTGIKLYRVCHFVLSCRVRPLTTFAEVFFTSFIFWHPVS